jgi:hypothetical protein
MIANHHALSNTKLTTFRSTKSMPRLRNRTLPNTTTLKCNGIPIHGIPILYFFTTVIDGVQGVHVMATYPIRYMPVITARYPISIRNDEIPTILVEIGFVESRFYRNQYFTSILSKPNFPYQIFLIEFTLPKTFLPKRICTTSLHCVYLRPIFLGIKLTACSTVSDFFLGGT